LVMVGPAGRQGSVRRQAAKGRVRIHQRSLPRRDRSEVAALEGYRRQSEDHDHP
jgi:hypothetical protein